MASLRHDFTDALRAAVKATEGLERWRVETGQAVPANLEAPFVLVTLKGWEPTPEAPRLYWTSEFVCSLFTPEQDPAKRADIFEDGGADLVEILEGLKYPGLIWTAVENVQYDGRPALDVTLTITNGKAA